LKKRKLPIQIGKESDTVKQNQLIAQQNKLLVYMNGLGIAVGGSHGVLAVRVKSFIVRAAVGI